MYLILQIKIQKSFFLLFIISIVALLNACDNSSAVQESKPVISKILPAHGPPGTRVTIQENGFSNNTLVLKMVFNGKSANVIQSGVDSIVTKVPEQATTGPVRVSVQGRTSNNFHFKVTSKTGTNTGITKVKPTQGWEGTKVNITVQGYELDKLATGVIFSDQKGAKILKFKKLTKNRTRITALVPNGATTGSVNITTIHSTIKGSDFIAKDGSKALKIPKNPFKILDNNDYEKESSKYSFFRMAVSKDLALFWARSYGKDPTLNVGKNYINPRALLDTAETYYQDYVNRLNFVTKGNSVSDKAKINIYVFPNKEGGTDYGGVNRNGVIPIGMDSFIENKYPE